MHPDYFAVPNLTFQGEPVTRPPVFRVAVFLAVVVVCLVTDALILIALYKLAAVLLTQFDAKSLGQIALLSTVALYLTYRLWRSVRTRSAGPRERGQESIGS